MPELTPATVALIGMTMVVGGLVKGVVGIGLPIAVMSRHVQA